MGKIKNNVITKGFSGKFGDDLLFRQVDNKTVFSRRTLVSAIPSARQLEIRNKFAEASNFASTAIENPQASQEYKLMAELQGLKSAYVAALSDYLSMPEVRGVFVTQYMGNVGDIITITSMVPYKIIGIDVSILRADGTVLESGKALPNQLKWRYTATVANPLVKGCKLVLLARDRQGMEVTFEKVL